MNLSIIRAPLALAALTAFSPALAGSIINNPFTIPVTGAITTPAVTAAGAPAPESVTLPLIYDGHRLFTEAEFRKADGTTHKALVWVNFGIGGMTVTAPLLKALGVGNGPVEFSLGGMPVRVEHAALLINPPEVMTASHGPLPVEAVIPAGLWPRFRLTIDYPAHTLTLARPSDAKAEGAVVPIKVNDQTGLMSTEVSIDGHAYSLVIDSGGGYTWMNGTVVRGWLPRHGDWYRFDNAIGAANQALIAENVAQLGTVVRVPTAQVGGLTLHDVGIFGTAPATGHPVDQVKNSLFWSLWGGGAPEPVVGWIGANIMQPYRITIDYKNHVSYWRKTGEEMAHELDSAPVSLIHTANAYVIGSVIARHGQPLAQGVEPGDTLVAIDGKPAAPMTRSAIAEALHGKPGEHHVLTLERKGRAVSADTVVVGETP